MSVIFYETVTYNINNGYRGAPLDDTYIHLKFADNFSKGYFFQYNQGEPTAGSTSPLWVVLLGLSGFLNDGLLFNAIFFSWLFFILSSLIIYKIVYYVTGEGNNLIALYSSLLFLFTGRLAFVSSSGMETSLFIFLLLLLIYIDILQKESFLIVKWIICGFLVNTRPEGFLLAILIFFKDILNFLLKKYSSFYCRRILLGLLFFSVLAAPYIIFSLYTNGSPFPNTFKGVKKIYSEKQSLDFFRKNAVFFIRDNILVLLLALGGLFSITKKLFKENKLNYLLIPFLYFFIHLGFSIFFFPNSRHYGRYFIPDFSLLILLSAYFIHNFFSMKKFSLKAQNLLLIFILSFSIPYFVKIAYDNANFVSNIKSMHVEAVNWINSNIPENSVIGLNDIGAIGYYTDNYIIDLEGLVTPDILKYRNLPSTQKNDSLIFYLNKKNAEYLIIFDNWYPGIALNNTNLLELVHSIFIRNNLILGSNKLSFYKFYGI